MATSGEDLNDTILGLLKNVEGMGIEKATMLKEIIKAISTGVYTHMQLLDDKTGMVPSVGHE